MSRRRFWQVIAFLLVGTAFSTLIAEETAKPSAVSRPVRPVSKKVAKASISKVRKLYGLDWHASLASAQQAAAPQEGMSGKPVFWLRMLGDLNGFS